MKNVYAILLTMFKKSFKPLMHQIKSLESFIASNNCHAYYWDVGTCKTTGALMCYEYLKHKGVVDRLLVLAPISLIEKAWGDDIKKFTTFEYTNFNREKKINSDICIVNLESFISKKKFQPIIEWCKQRNTMCVIDESQKIKNHKSISTTKILSASELFKAKLLLSATPAPNDYSEYWGQMCFLSKDIFNPRFFAFRYRYFTLTRGDFVLPSGGLSKSEIGKLMKKGFKYRMIKTKRDEFFQKIAPYVTKINKRDVLDLPDEIDETRSVILGKEQRIKYNEMKYQLITEIQGKDVVAQVALAKLTRLRQIVSGFSKSNEGDIVELKENPKLNELKATLDEIGDHQVLIFCQYHKEMDDIQKLYESKCEILDGRTVDKNQVIQNFKDNKTQYLIAHPKSAGCGLSFNDVDYMIYYSLSYSAEDYVQTKGRIVRAFKKNNAIFIHLIAENTIDEIILNCVRNKMDKSKIMEGFLK